MGIRLKPRIRTAGTCLVLAAIACTQQAAMVFAQSSPVVLDRVVAVVNNHAILSSDVENEIHLSVLEPRESGGAPPTRPSALEDLISRTLIEQQIPQDDAQAASVSGEKVGARLAQLRKDLPVCVRMHCDTEDGWAAFLKANDLTEAQVEGYLRRRLEILSFIEDRFRQGIRISQEDVDAYYRNSLLPLYARGERPPPLTEVASRIEEILLQQQVNALFGAWLDNLRKQGDIEIVDPSLELTATAPHPAGDKR